MPLNRDTENEIGRSSGDLPEVEGEVVAGVGPSIEWTRPKLERFKKALDANNSDTFTFEGHEFVKEYAAYLVQYLEGQLA